MKLSRFCLCSSISWIALLAACKPAPVEPEAQFDVNAAIEYCLSKTRTTAEKLDSSDLTLVDIEQGQTFWNTRSASRWGWTHGFWPGILWYAYEASEDDFFLRKAKAATSSLAQTLARAIRSHDVGFIFICSYGNGLRLTNNDNYADTLVLAADKLSELFNPTTGTLLSWPAKVEDETYFPHNTIIDSMMNLELLFRASQLSGDSRYANIARTHADTTLRHHIRADNSTYHVIVYHNEPESVKAKVTHQGYANDSMWARGQAWAIYGFTMTYRETRDIKYLQTAQRLADKYLQELPEDYVPYWDFDAPITSDTPRDASAAAISASALLELSTHTDDDKLAKSYFDAALNMLRSLSAEPYRSPPEIASFLMRSTGSKPRGREVDVPLIYADYYYLEALLRLRKLSQNVDKLF